MAFRVLTLAALLGLVPSAPTSAAVCVRGRAFFATEPDLPLNPNLFLFDPHLDVPPPKVTSPQARLVVKELAMTARPAVRVFRISLAKPNNRLRTLAVQVHYETSSADMVYDGGPDISATFALNPNWRPPAEAKQPATLRATPYGSDQRGWASGQELLASVKAPAYRIIWAPTRELYDRGSVGDVILPLGKLQLGPPLWCSRGKVTISFGMTIDWPLHMNVPIYVGAIPLFSDGREGQKPRATRIEPPPRPASPSERMVSPPQTIGVAECDDYLARITACLAKLPSDLSAAMTPGLAQVLRTWEFIARHSPDRRDEIKKTCVDAVSVVKATCK
jgi:hypothetical protein